MKTEKTEKTVHIKLIQVDAAAQEEVVSYSTDYFAASDTIGEVVLAYVNQTPPGDLDYDDERSVETGHEWFSISVVETCRRLKICIRNYLGFSPAWIG